MNLRKLLLVLALPFATEAALAFDCIEYAERASRQGRVNTQLGCKYTGPRWNLSQQVHLSWCMSADLDTAQAEDQVRREDLKACVDQSPQIQNCREYATIAGLQNTANITLGCGLRGVRWNAKWNDHYNWCDSVFYNIDLRDAIAVEDRTRRDMLLICLDRE